MTDLSSFLFLINTSEWMYSIILTQDFFIVGDEKKNRKQACVRINRLKNNNGVHWIFILNTSTEWQLF